MMIMAIYIVNVVKHINQYQNFILILAEPKIGITIPIIAKHVNLSNIKLEGIKQYRMIPIFSLEI